MDGNDTREYQSGAVRGGGAQPAPRTRGYWVGPNEGKPSAPETSPVRRGPRHPRRVVAWVSALVVLGALAIFAGLVLTGTTVVPGLSARIFPIHYQEEIARAAAKYHQDPYLVAAVVKAESGYDPEAVSPVGAVGLMQLMPDTADWVAGKTGAWRPPDRPVLTDPVDSLELGVWYLDYLGDLFGDGTRSALAAYNAGPASVQGWIEEAGGLEQFESSDLPFPETREYVERVEHYRQLYLRIHPDIFGSPPGAERLGAGSAVDVLACTGPVV